MSTIASEPTVGPNFAHAPDGEPGAEPAAHMGSNGAGDDLIARRRAAVAGLVGVGPAEVGAMVADLS